MIEIVLQAEIDEAVKAIDFVRRAQLPFATSYAVNLTAKDGQEAVRRHVKQAFTLRREKFVLQTVKIEKYDFATKRNPSTFRLKIDETPSRDFLAKHEDQGQKVSLDPTFPIAIPSTAARPAFSMLVPARLYPGALRLAPRRGVVGTFFTTAPDGKSKRRHVFGTLPVQQRRTKRGVLQWTGKRRTFVLDPREHFGVKTWGVYQRTGPGRGDVQLLWTYKTRIPIPPRLRFVATVRETVAQRLAANFATAYARALATAR